MILVLLEVSVSLSKAKALFDTHIGSITMIKQTNASVHQSFSHYSSDLYKSIKHKIMKLCFER